MPGPELNLPTRKARPLKRVVGPIGFTIYGVGTIIGGGIYVLIGAVAAYAEALLPFAFLVAGAIALLTALVYAELGRLFPKSAADAVFVYEGFQSPLLARLVGIIVMATGIVSAAAVTRGLTGYLGYFVQMPDYLAVLIVVGSLTLVAVIGMGISAGVVIGITLAEIFGLGLVSYTGLVFGGAELHMPIEANEALSADALSMVLSGAFVAFYAFIGFEDMVNIAEEVKQPERSLKIALPLSVVIATFIYCLVTFAVMRLMPMADLIDSRAPLADAVDGIGGPGQLVAGIGVISVLNGALVQIIMVSRLLYGLAQAGLAPVTFAYTHPRWRTPVPSILFAAILVVFFVFTMPLQLLAELTSSLILLVFIAVNLSYMRIRIKDTEHSRTTLPLIMPVLATGACIAMFVVKILW